MKNILKLQDEEGHFYWIPKNTADQFNDDLEFIIGKDYLDCPNEFNNFIHNYEKYRTLGDRDLIPDFYKKIYITKINGLFESGTYQDLIGLINESKYLHKHKIERYEVYI